MITYKSGVTLFYFFYLFQSPLQWVTSCAHVTCNHCSYFWDYLTFKPIPRNAPCYSYTQAGIGVGQLLSLRRKSNVMMNCLYLHSTCIFDKENDFIKNAMPHHRRRNFITFYFVNFSLIPFSWDILIFRILKIFFNLGLIVFMLEESLMFGGGILLQPILLVKLKEDCK